MSEAEKPEVADLRKRLAILDELRAKFAPMSPRTTVVYPSISPEQCALLAELLECERGAVLESIAARLGAP